MAMFLLFSFPFKPAGARCRPHFPPLHPPVPPFFPRFPHILRQFLNSTCPLPLEILPNIFMQVLVIVFHRKNIIRLLLPYLFRRLRLTSPGL
jgi:hypothetical protein